jgi:hypothetical protein
MLERSVPTPIPTLAGMIIKGKGPLIAAMQASTCLPSAAYSTAMPPLWAHGAIIMSIETLSSPGLLRPLEIVTEARKSLSHLDTGLNFGIKGFTVRPFDSFDYITQTENKYNESGAGAFDLAVLEKKFNMYRNELGINFARCFNIDPDNKITIDAKLSWVYEKRIQGKATTASFLGTTLAKSPKFTVHSYYTSRSLISPGLTISYINDIVDLEVYYDGEFGTKYRNQTVGLQAGYSF